MIKTSQIRELFEYGVVRCGHGRHCTVCCWGWCGGFKKGIPHISIRKQQWRASKTAWRLQYGKRPDGKLMSSCGNSACTNPFHWHTSKSKVFIAHRFWSKVQRCDHDWTCETCCWPWLAGANPDGYGNFFSEGHTYGAPRVSWSLYWNKGVIPTTVEEVRHSCHKPICCNPNHLSIGSHADNMLDRPLANRSASTLKAEDVLSIRALYSTGKYSLTKLACLYKVSISRISFILNRKSWIHLTDDLQPKIDLFLQAYTNFGGRKHKNALIESEILKIRELFSSGNYTQDEIGKKFNITQKQVSAIVRGESWSNVDGPVTQVGRGITGELNVNNKLSVGKVAAIKKMLESGRNQRLIASDFHVSQSTVSKIKQGKMWNTVS